LHYLASLGCPVPGEEARLLLCDRIFTHFERAEDVETASGKLRDDLVRMRAVLDAATPASLIILNETFASTTVRDALIASRRIMTRLSELDALTVSVTFLDELANFDAKTVSMVALMDADDPDRRTFHVERRPADGVSYALAVARRHGLTYDQLKERLPR
jgi:DNA mismatch repair ATPase MutS